VGEPSREFLWILSRTPTLAASDRAVIEARLLEQGYDVGKLKEEPQQ
jgi:apolipoprotein D and lipocalin family protein